jgi:diaminohydroxyphosphoribosylaminopyrimidine deaminase/5-amino-6-(5-phosphoribosylamino)uracil reductase
VLKVTCPPAGELIAGLSDNAPMTLNATDEQWMKQALAFAGQAMHITSPNPRVGCLITDSTGRVLGQGHTQAAGQAHAEIVALADAKRQGHTVKGATAYVTLEPCSHQGRTGPCCVALSQAGLSRVVVAIQDPNPQVSGAGIAHLRAHGIQVDVGLMADQARELNVGFFQRMTMGRPWVRMKIAASLDGQTALNNGVSQWITCEAARADGHAWRARACAVLTGHGTVIEDDPLLDVRAVDTPRQPILVLVDSRFETPSEARLWQPNRAVWIYGAQDDATAIERLKQLRADVRRLPDSNGKVDLAAMLSDLGRRGINELHVEAGHKLNGSLLKTGLVNELLIYMAPKMLGSGRGMAQLGPWDRLDQALGFQWTDCQRVGNDLRLIARKG